MRGATINGRPAEQVFDALRGDIPGVIKSMEDNRAYPYLAMEGVFEHYRDSDRIVFKAFKKGCA